MSLNEKAVFLVLNELWLRLRSLAEDAFSPVLF
jgi:hypothetical protein